jgi:HNH endonuclease
LSEAKVCDVCGGPTGSGYGVCQETPECKHEYMRRWHDAHRSDSKVCLICEGPLRSDNEIGVCRKTPECARERKRRYHEANPEAAREYERRSREANPEGHREKQRRRRARKRDLPSERIDEQALYGEQNGKCGLCGKPLGDEWHLDHIVPLSKGGWHVTVNVHLTHPHCNLSKLDSLDWSARSTIATIVDMLCVQPSGWVVEVSRESFVTIAA